MRKTVATLAALAALGLGNGAAFATEPPTTECGDVVEGFPVGDNADLCDNPPLPEPDLSTPIPDIPPLVVDPSPQPVQPVPLAPAVVVVPAAPAAAAVAPPVIAEQPVPVQMPVGTAQRVAAGQELAYTGPADTAAILAVSTFVIAGGAGLVLASRHTKKGMQ